MSREPMKCGHCGSDAVLGDSATIYGRSYGPAWMCARYPDCDSYCGCHKGGTKPLGTLANREEREWRKRVHALIDPLWFRGTKYQSHRRRGRIYARISDRLGKQYHTGESDVETCKLVIEWVSADPQSFVVSLAALEGEAKP